MSLTDMLNSHTMRERERERERENISYEWHTYLVGEAQKNLL